MQKVSDKMWRIIVLVGIMGLCLITASIILTGIKHFKIGSQLASSNQVSNLSHLLVRQQAKLFSLMLVKNVGNDELVDALNAFAKEDFVIDAHIYAPNGVVLAQSRHSLPFTPLNNAMANTQQIVEPILAQQDLIGFLRVTFDTQYGQTTQHKVNELFHLLYGQLVILFLAGGLFASCFYYFNRRKGQILHNASPILNTERKSQSQRFHSRRRAFGRK